MLGRVRLPDPGSRLAQYPHELSGGMRQRVAIALALMARPRILFADEPTTALDVTVQAEVMALLAELCRDLGMSLLLVTHDLGVVAALADRIAVMYAGRIVEEGAASTCCYIRRIPIPRACATCAIAADFGRDLGTIPGAPLPTPRYRLPLRAAPPARGRALPRRGSGVGAGRTGRVACHFTCRRAYPGSALLEVREACVIYPRAGAAAQMKAVDTRVLHAGRGISGWSGNPDGKTTLVALSCGSPLDTGEIHWSDAGSMRSRARYSAHRWRELHCVPGPECLPRSADDDRAEREEPPLAGLSSPRERLARGKNLGEVGLRRIGRSLSHQSSGGRRSVR
jgi:ABC-type glutathione transport system ATPase component